MAIKYKCLFKGPSCPFPLIQPTHKRSCNVVKTLIKRLNVYCPCSTHHEVCLTSVNVKASTFLIFVWGTLFDSRQRSFQTEYFGYKLESHYWHIRVISWIGFPWFSLQNQVQLTSLRKCWFCLSLSYQLVRIMITVWCFYKRRLKCHTSSMTPLKVSDSHCL